MRSWKRMQQQTGWPWGIGATILYCLVPLVMIGVLLWSLPYLRDGVRCGL
jgi:hypothetical protein